MKLDPRPLLLGSGKLARHWSHYFQLKNISYLEWKKPHELNRDFEAILSQASSVWVLVSDRAIAELVQKILSLAPTLPILHSSAALSISGACTIHPLQTFGPELYSLEAYEKITFTLIEEEWKSAPEAAKNLIERLGNQTQTIPHHARTRYHANCVMVANFPQILWSAVFSNLADSGSLSANAFHPLLKQSVENFLVHGSSALTGPLVRNDQITLQKHLTSLANTPLAHTYQTFIELYSSLHEGKSTS